MAPLVGRLTRPLASASVAACVAASALVLGVSPALALVTATTEDGDTVVIESDAAPDSLTMTCLSGQALVNGSLPLPTLACQDVAFVEVEPRGGADTVDLSGVTLADFPDLEQAAVDVADSATDTVTGSEGRDVVHADGSDVVSTGPGEDWVEGGDSVDGGAGDDTLRQVSGALLGGPGDDLLVNPGGGPIDGGPGVDTITVDYSLFTSPLAVGLVLTDATINGSVTALGIEAYDVTASDGGLSDTVDARGYSGRVSMHARAGADTFLGGPGADVADTGSGNDVVDPGPGSDLVLAGDGDDTIAARDGFRDVVECGPGDDTVEADRNDAVSGCEHVSLLPPDTGAVLGEQRVARGVKALFTFSSPVPGATFECQVDTAAFRACTSPYTVRTRRLGKGRHTLSVRAVQPAGNPDPTPSTFRFKVTKPPRTPHA